MKYREPELPSPLPDWRSVQAPSKLAELLLAMSLEGCDRDMVEEACTQSLRHPNVDVARAAAVSLGHLARLQGLTAPGVTIKLLQQQGWVRPELVGTIDNALDDIDVFCRGKR